VLARRADGYHEIESLVSPVTLFDELSFSGREDSSVELLCEHPAIPTDGRNLILRAADLLKIRTGYRCGATCRLTKRIPIGGGLGGGSSNAASTLLALDSLWNLKLSREELASMAAELGSDVTLFVSGGSAVIRGRGERVQRVPFSWTGVIVLLLPPFSTPTPAVYREWRGEAGPALPIVPTETRNARELMHATFNMLEAPATRVSPPLSELLRLGSKLADRPVRLSGSGSTLFTAFEEDAEARVFAARAAEELQVGTQIVRMTEGIEAVSVPGTST
jgi:4-diphosphocytidyl-2-C-methyl-D-erythritol kinase